VGDGAGVALIGLRFLDDAAQRVEAEGRVGVNARLIELQNAGDLDPAFLHRKSLKIANRLGFMERLLEDMRNYAQPVSGERAIVPIAELFTEARSIVSENLKARNISARRVDLSVQLSPEATVKVSRVHIVTALVNVLKNAYEFLPTNSEGPVGQIDVRVALRAKQVHVTVRDTGQGIPAANLDEVRQCLPGRTSRRHVGTGFGLCNAQRYVEAHGGKLWIESEENKGTTVTLILPAG
jgi:signal transduction histidine kinase